MSQIFFDQVYHPRTICHEIGCWLTNRYLSITPCFVASISWCAFAFPLVAFYYYPSSNNFWKASSLQIIDCAKLYRIQSHQRKYFQYGSSLETINILASIASTKMELSVVAQLILSDSISIKEHTFNTVNPTRLDLGI